MKIYTERPTPRKAQKVWDFIANLRGKEPNRLWYNANCWGGSRIAGNAWGWWVAEFDDSVFKYEYIRPDRLAKEDYTNREKGRYVLE